MFRQLYELYDIFDNDKDVAARLAEKFIHDKFSYITIRDRAECDFIKIVFPGSRGKLAGGTMPTLGIIGELYGIGLYPDRIGIVSDADGGLAVLTAASKISELQQRGIFFPGDIVVTANICPHGIIEKKYPVDFIALPAPVRVMNEHLVTDDMDAILSVDTTKGNWRINRKGIAITPTVKAGYILNTSYPLMEIMTVVSGDYPAIIPITTADLTYYHNGLYHINSILQPALHTDSPVVGLGMTSCATIPGTATSVSCAETVEMGARFCLEVAKELPLNQSLFYEQSEYDRLVELYGGMKHLVRYLDED